MVENFKYATILTSIILILTIFNPLFQLTTIKECFALINIIKVSYIENIPYLCSVEINKHIINQLKLIDYEKEYQDCTL